MDATFLHGLPPLKRLRFMQQQQQQQEQKQQQLQPHHHSTCSPLPAKKRKESRDPPQSLPSSVSAYSLPAKKRVCALHPHLASNVAFSPVDLNVESNPFLEKEDIKPVDDDEHGNKIPLAASDRTNPSSEKARDEEDGGGDAEEGDDDDGIVCVVCQSTDGDPTDPIVLCDGCDLMVHVSCYGNPLSKGIPEGDWFCERCLVSSSEETSEGESKREKGFSSYCCLCPVKEGAMKPTTDQRWAHIVCALLVPEVFFVDPEGREGIDCSEVPMKRWLERCYVCNSSNGCAIVCSEPKCSLAFHVTCGLKEDLCIEYKQEKKKGAVIVAGFCKSHTELWEKQQQSGKYKIVAREDEK